jgi:hypothetical protein
LKEVNEMLMKLSFRSIKNYVGGLIKSVLSDPIGGTVILVANSQTMRYIIQMSQDSNGVIQMSVA